MAYKHPNDMNLNECRDELYDLESLFQMSEGGISSKDAIRHRLCKFKVDYYEQFGKELPLGEDVWEFMKDAHKLFAPAGCKCGICWVERQKQEV